MYLSDASRTAQWLSDNFGHWLRKDSRAGQTFIDYPVTTYPPDYIHASSIAHCPKKTALERHELVPRVFDDYTALRMRQGTSMGKVIVEYARDLTELHNSNPDKDRLMAYDYEYQFVDHQEKLAGRADLMCWFHFNNFIEYWPIECKLTDAWKFGGLTLDHFAQTAMYIRLQRSNPLAVLLTGSVECNTGFIFTIYDKVDAGKQFRNSSGEPTAWAVWIVQRNEADNGFLLFNQLGQPVKVDGRSFLSDADLDDWLDEHHTWDRMVTSGRDLTNVTPYLDPSEHWMCASIVPADPRERAWKGEPAGSPKVGTGIVRVRCPIFHLCWEDWLIERGITPSATMPRELKIKVADEQAS